jgi:hypothetical protein
VRWFVDYVVRRWGVGDVVGGGEFIVVGVLVGEWCGVGVAREDWVDLLRDGGDSGAVDLFGGAGRGAGVERGGWPDGSSDSDRCL